MGIENKIAMVTLMNHFRDITMSGLLNRCFPEQELPPPPPPPKTDAEKLEIAKKYLRIQKHLTERMLLKLEE